MTRAARNISFPSPIVRATNRPPCGALIDVAKAIASAPAVAEPMTIEGMTRIGSAAANGIAPSVMKEAPMIRFVGPDRSEERRVGKECRARGGACAEKKDVEET